MYSTAWEVVNWESRIAALQKYHRNLNKRNGIILTSRKRYGRNTLCVAADAVDFAILKTLPNELLMIVEKQRENRVLYDTSKTEKIPAERAPEHGRYFHTYVEKASIVVRFRRVLDPVLT